MISRSRREVLAALLGVPALAALGTSGCSRKVIPAGEIVGGDVALGHLLRQPTPGPEGTEVQKVPILVVGSGMAGLSACWRLGAEQQLSYLLLELESEPGGTARSGQNAVSAYPWAAHYVPVPSPRNRALIRLLKEMGAIEGMGEDGELIVPEELLVQEPEQRVFYQGQWHEGLLPKEALSSYDNQQMQRFHELIDEYVAFRDSQGRRGFALPMALGSDEPHITELDSLSMASWMDQKGLHSRHLRWYVDLACRDDYGCNLENTSAWAGLFYFAARLSAPGAESASFITWPEGNGRVIKHLQKQVAKQLRTGQLVCDIIPQQNQVEVRVIDGASRKPYTIIAEQVILAVPHFIAMRLLSPWRERPPEGYREFDTSPWLVANITLSERPRSVGFGPAWDNVFYDSPSLGYVVATHQQGRSFGPTVLTYYYAFTDASSNRARQKLYSASREEWVEVILADMSQAHPDIRPLVERIDIYRWGHAMIRPRPGFVWSRARRMASQSPFERVHLASTDLSAIALMEEAQYHGIRAAEKVLRGRGIVTDSWL